MALSSLIERLEKAEGPDRELDAAIECELRRWQAYALDLNDKVRSHWKPIGIKGEVIDDQGITRYHAPERTRSIDAALTLVPEGFKWKTGYSRHVPHNAVIQDYRANPIFGAFTGECDSNRAIAICIASLRARSAMTEEGSNG